MKISILILLLSVTIAGQSQTATYEFNQAVELLDQGSPQLALVSIDKAIAIDENYKFAYFVRGKINLHLSDFLQALKDFNTAHNKAPNVTNIIYHRGMAKDKLNDYYGAINDYNMVISKSPSSIEVFFLRGKMRFMVKDLEGAVQDLNVYIERSAAAKGYYLRACALYSLGKFPQACQDWSKAGELGNYEAYQQINENCK